MKETDTGERTRAEIYLLLGRLLGEPAAEPILQMLRDLAVPPAKENFTAALQTLRQAARDARAEDVEEEFNVLFIGLGRGELVPYGSHYMAGKLMDQPLATVRRDLAAFGVERRAHVREPEDHIAALCETMAVIIPLDEEVPFDSQRAFFTEHLEPWAGPFFHDLRCAGSAKFYRAVAAVGEQFMSLESGYFNMANS
jgi:TorA maturation chaperone TorD